MPRFLLFFWLDAIYVATLTISRLPSPVLKNKSPYEIFFAKAPDYGLIIFGYFCKQTLLLQTNFLLGQHIVYFYSMLLITRDIDAWMPLPTVFILVVMCALTKINVHLCSLLLEFLIGVNLFPLMWMNYIV